MKHTEPILIAGERFEDLVDLMRRMPITGIDGRRARLTFSYDDPTYAAWTRAAERYAADLLTPECELTWQERLDLGAQSVVDEIERELQKGSHQ